MGMHTDVQMCAWCMCVYRRSRQLTAGLKQKAYTLLTEEESKEMREVHDDRGREEGELRKEKERQSQRRLTENKRGEIKSERTGKCADVRWRRHAEKNNTTQGYASQNERQTCNHSVD